MNKKSENNSSIVGKEEVEEKEFFVDPITNICFRSDYDINNNEHTILENNEDTEDSPHYMKLLDNVFKNSKEKYTAPERTTTVKMDDPEFKDCNNQASSFVQRKRSWKRMLTKRLPFIQTLSTYKWSYLPCDLMAGLTVALTVIPQGIGYAPLAGLSLQYGLYASIFPGFIYALLGTCKEVTIGPTAVNSLMSFNYAGTQIHRSATLAFFSGIIEMTVGALNLGFLINFVSTPVISAFTSAVSLQVATSQIKPLLGISHIPGRGFLQTWKAVFSNFQYVRPCDATLGFSSIAILLFLRKLKDMRWFESPDSERLRSRVVSRMKWVISISRNCIIILFSASLAYLLIEVYGWPKDIFVLTGEIESGLPKFDLPWNIKSMESLISSTISTRRHDLLEMVEEFGVGLLLLPLVSLIQHLAIAKFYTPINKKVNASQEMIALGASQFLGSFIGSMPVTASFGRSAVNSASGVRTTMGGIVTGIVIVMTCAFLTPHFAFIPKASLAAVIITAMIFTFDVDILLPIWRSSKRDLIPYSLTFFLGVIVRVEVGMIVGTLSHLCILLSNSTQPNFEVQKRQIQNLTYYIVKPDRALFFPTVDKIRNFIGTPPPSSVNDKACLNNDKFDIKREEEQEKDEHNELMAVKVEGSIRSTTTPSNNDSIVELDRNFRVGEIGEDNFNCQSTTISPIFDGGVCEIAPKSRVMNPMIIVDMSSVVQIDFTAAKAIRALIRETHKLGKPIYLCCVSIEVESVLQGVDSSLLLTYSSVSDVESKIFNSLL